MTEKKLVIILFQAFIISMVSKTWLEVLPLAGLVFTVGAVLIIIRKIVREGFSLEVKVLIASTVCGYIAYAIIPVFWGAYKLFQIFVHQDDKE